MTPIGGHMFIVKPCAINIRPRWGRIVDLHLYQYNITLARVCNSCLPKANSSFAMRHTESARAEAQKKDNKLNDQHIILDLYEYLFNLLVTTA